MEIEFYKYHGNGNDFVILNNISGNLILSIQQIAQICDRRFGIGADGLIFINKSDEADFEMVYHNSDGNVGSMCGNGGRCIAAFAYSLNLVSNEMVAPSDSKRLIKGPSVIVVAILKPFSSL